MRIIARLTKGEGARFVSHLDIQRLLQRAFRRADIPLAYSQGFNPHPQLSFATALSTGYTSDAEWFDVRLDGDMPAEAFIERVNGALPKDFTVAEAYAAPDKLSALTAMLESASYVLSFAPGTDAAALEKDVNGLLMGEIVVDKRTKGGIKAVDIRHQVMAVSVFCSDGFTRMEIKGALNAAGSLNIDLFMGALSRLSGKSYEYGVHRKSVAFAGGMSVPVN